MKKSIAALVVVTVVLAAVAGIATASSAKREGTSGKNIVQTAVAAGGEVFVGGARVVTPDVMASNGVIHVINKVLIPR